MSLGFEKVVGVLFVLGLVFFSFVFQFFQIVAIAEFVDANSLFVDGDVGQLRIHPAASVEVV